MPATQPYDERVFALIQYVAEGRFYTAKTRRPGPYPQSVPLRCVANSLDRFNIKRRLSKIPMSRQISFRAKAQQLHGYGLIERFVQSRYGSDA
jgi:hypothetical protein